MHRRSFVSEAGRLRNWIGGEWRDAETSEYLDVFNPATAEVIARVPLSTQRDVGIAVAAAVEAFQAWSKTPIPRRARIFFRYQQLLVDHWDELAQLIVRENGKSYKDAYGEVQRAIENVEFAASAPTLLMGEQLANIATSLDSGMYRYPLGVVAGITPFNFPMMVPCWMFPLAIVCGNTFVLKPSERTPLLAQRLAELLDEAGLPSGVFNIVHGAREVVQGLIGHPEIRAISFVGSQPVAAYVYREAAAHGKRVQALAGAKNHTIVMPDANLHEAIPQIISAAFGSAGERCMACSVVVAVGAIADSLVNGLKSAADDIRIGNGLDDDVLLGPVIRAEHRERALQYIDLGIQEGAVLVRDGRQDRVEADGYFVGPTIFDHVHSSMKIWQDEIFAPVLSIARVETLDDAIALANQSKFALGARIFTNDASAIRQFREEIDAGMLGVNVGVPAPMAFFPFSGWKDSFYGDLHANGKDGVAFYTRRKMITTRV